MRPCFVCGCDWACSHREPELIAWEYGIRSGMATLNEREAAQTAATSRKPPAIAPAAPEREIKLTVIK